MRKISLLSVFWLASLGGGGLEAVAFDLGHVNINGFVSQGFIQSSGNNFLADSEGGSFQLNEVGLTVGAQVTPRLRIGTQLLSRDIGEEGDNEVRLDWGFADYRYRDWLGFRIGKIKLPMGLYNEGRDSDFLRAMAFLPQSVYDENKRNLLVAAQGAGIYGNVPLGQTGDLDYQLFYGEINFPDDSPIIKGFLGASNEVAAMKRPGVRVTRIDPENKYVYGGSLIYNAWLEGLRLGATIFQGRSEFTGFLSNSTQELFSVRMQDMAVFSIEYATPSLVLASEYIRFRLKREFFGTQVAPGHSEGWYGMVSWRFFDRLSLSVLYDIFYEDRDDKGGDNFARRGKPDYLGWRKDLGIGARYDINDFWVAKAEWHSVDGAALGLPVFNPEGVEEEWSYFILKTSFNF